MRSQKSTIHFTFCLLNVVFICSLFLASPFKYNTYAYEKDLPNNKFGIHLAQPHLEDLEKAKALVNSNGGDWGYITLVIQEDDRDKDKWQNIFNRLRKLHLIPIIRIATKPEGGNWRRPTKEDADPWVSFLDSLHWVVKPRYIVLFNEPNHASEWGGKVDPKDYAEVALKFARKLKEKNSDFFVMFAGLDASAPSSRPLFEDESVFLQELFNNVTVEQFNNLFSGWVSHSYPNPGFIGSPYAFGKGTIRTYQWELDLLSQWVNKDLPVFITETGWDGERLSRETVAEYLHVAYEQVWLPDAKVVAVTPFVLDYQSEPFLRFSWKLPQNGSVLGSATDQFYPQYTRVESLAKISGQPEQIEKGIIDFDLPKELVAHSSYRFTIKIKNDGQGFWDKDDGYELSVYGNQDKNIKYLFSDIKNIAPFESTEINLYVKTSDTVGEENLQIALNKDNKEVLKSKSWKFSVFPLPKLELKVDLYPKIKNAGDDFELQIFNEKEELVFKKTHIKVTKGNATVENVQNIVLSKKYRIVILNPYYLPRQEFLVFTKDGNKVQFKPMLPFDFNKDGKFDLSDVIRLLSKPSLIFLLIP